MSVPPGVLRAAALVLATLAGCGRDPLPESCPPLAAGDLVISELRGAQSNDQDEGGEWVELYNDSGAALDLAGVRVEVTKLDGSATAAFLVRSHETVLEADGYAALGRFDAGAEPAHIAYGYRGDLDAELYTSAAIEILACDRSIDRVIYRGLTDFGSLALDGAIDPPSSEANDDETAFCVDDALDEAAPSAGARGTPGGPNPPCE